MKGILSGSILACGLAAATISAADLGTAFTYQGFLENGSGPVTGACEFEFRLWDDPLLTAAQNQVGGVTLIGTVNVTAGVFTTDLDFGSMSFNGNTRWLQLNVCCPSPCTPVLLTPRVELKPAPHALALPGFYTQQNAISPNLIGGYIGNVVSSGVVGATIAGGGHTNDPFAPPDNNRVTDDLGTVGGGRGNQAGDGAGTTSDQLYATVCGGDGNTASGAVSAIVGGSFNTARGYLSFVGGGHTNTAGGDLSTVGGGSSNFAGSHCADQTEACISHSDCPGGSCVFGDYPTIAGGSENFSIATGATIAGGFSNRASAEFSSIGGGRGNRVLGLGMATVAGGESNIANALGSSVGGGLGNYAGRLCVGGSRDDLPCGLDSDCPGGICPVGPYYQTVAGGLTNTAGGHASTVGGGNGNSSIGEYSVVGGGSANSAGNYSSIGGGSNNSASGSYAIIGGGKGNSALGEFSSIGGGGPSTFTLPWVCSGGPDAGLPCGRCVVGGATCSDNTPCGAPVPVCARDETLCAPPGLCGTTGAGNQVTGDYGIVGGGSENEVGAPYGNVGGGFRNSANGEYATTGGGETNNASGNHSVVAGGRSNDATGSSSTVCGGGANDATGNSATVGGGSSNNAIGNISTIGGGGSNSATALYSTIPGGFANDAGGEYSLVAGRRGTIRTAAQVGGGDTNGDEGTFLWADSTNADFTSDGPNKFLARSSGGATFYSNASATTGVNLPAGGGSWSSVSDRNLKKNFAEVDVRAILDHLSTLPITTWNYGSQDNSIRHIGPMGQEFYEAFGVGEEATRIATIDADGVALAAIQGLHQLVQDRDCAIDVMESEISDFQSEISNLKSEIIELRALVRTLAEKNGGGQ